MYNDPTIIMIIILAVLAGGLIKGTLGFGMPMVALPIIAFTIPATTAMILLCAPIFLTNFLQIKFKEGISSYRFLPMFLFLVFGLIIGARLILEINLNTITQIIALSIIFAALVNCFGFKISNIKNTHEKIITSINSASERASAEGRQAVMVVSPAIRKQLSAIIRHHVDDMIVLGFTELPDSRKINIIATISGENEQQN